jgi:hypothetical protein
MGHELIFIMQGGGNMMGIFNVWSWEKNGPILRQPQVWNMNECLAINNWSAH